jgi:hypothetical protein
MFQAAITWVVAEPVLAATAAGVACVIFGNIARTTFYAWYVLMLVAAFAAGEATGGRLYFYAFALGTVTAFAEIIGKFRDEPLKSLTTAHAVFYHLFNGLISVLALKIYFMNAGPAATDLEQFKAVIIAGLGAMLLMRSKLFNIRVGSEDVSFGPEQIIKVFLSFMEGAIDRVRAQSRIDFVRKELNNIDFDRVIPYCETMLAAAQTLNHQDRQEIGEEVDKLRTTNVETQLKSYRLGFLLLNRMGEDYVSKLFAEPPVEWMIKAPAAEKKEGLSALLPFKKDDTIYYLAYGSSMLRRRMLERLRWSDPGSAGLLESAAPRRCVLEGYRLAFNKPDNTSRPVYGLANIVKQEQSTVEGVLYRLTPAGFEFLSATEDGYRRETVTVTVDGKPVAAYAFVAESPREGLRPPRNYLQMVITGAREHGLSDTYLAELERTPTAPADVEFVAAMDSRIAVQPAPAV